MYYKNLTTKYSLSSNINETKFKREKNNMLGLERNFTK